MQRNTPPCILASEWQQEKPWQQFFDFIIARWQQEWLASEKPSEAHNLQGLPL